MSVAVNELSELLEEWREELSELQEKLYMLGAKAESFEYNLVATQALTLSLCIDRVMRALLVLAKNREVENV